MKQKYLILFLLLISSVHGLSISGDKLVIENDFSPNLVTENSYLVKNGESYVSDYYIVNTRLKGADLTPYLTFEPERIENVQPGETRGLTIRCELPDSIDIPGETENWIAVRMDTSSSGAITAHPSVAIRYLLFVLYPYKYIEYTTSFPNSNINEATEFKISIENLGEQTINKVYATMDIYNQENQNKIASLRTNNIMNFNSWDKGDLISEFDNTGLLPGSYLVNYTLYWDENISQGNQEIRIGSKNVNILNFTKLFEYDSINKFDILIESAWNSKIEDISADIFIYDLSGNQLKKFKSINMDLNPWETKTLDAYFDTKGLEKGEYKARVVLNYGGVSVAEDNIKIDENIGAEIFEEMPGKFHLSSLTAYLTTINMLYFMIGIFVILNIVLLTGLVRKKPEQKDEKIDSAVIDKIKEMRKQFKDSYIKEMMLKKGWQEEKINYILKEAKK